MRWDAWSQLWGEPDEESEGESFVLPKFYPGPRVRCPNCGFWQGNEAVLDTYRWCMRCCTVLQDPATLYWDEPVGVGDLRVVAASYGHKRDPRLAFDVRLQLQARVDGRGAADRLEIARTEDLTAWLGNPCPGQAKTLRIRYMFLTGRAGDRRREVWLQESQEGNLTQDVLLQANSKLPLVLLFSAIYGSPGGSSRGRGTFDVTEFMQGRVDLAGGQYLFLSKTEPLIDLFGDPCPGRDKTVVLHYEILGTEGKAEAQESDGRLLTPVSISCTPMLAPLIVIESATYGQIREGIDERLVVIQRELSDLLAMQNRKDMGMPVSRDQNMRLMRLRPLIAELEYLQKVTPRHIDVTARVQRRVERLGGGVLELVALREDLNRFCGGNPLPGEKKELRVRYLVVGHDSEQLTSLEETTTSGYPRNFILQRKGQVVIQVTDDKMGRGVLDTDVLIDSPKVLPVIEILSASYGHPRNSTKTYDICTKLRAMIDKQGGERLQIGCDDDLRKMFDEPCRGVRKKMKITYVARGLNGHMRVNERDRHLVSDIIVGYYSREKFSHSELLAKRYALSPSNAMITSGTLDPAAKHFRSSTEPSCNSNNKPEDYDDDNAHGLEQPLPSMMSITVMDAHSTGRASSAKGGAGTAGYGSASGNNDALALARRQAKRERRNAHQVAIRRKAEERENARRRLLVEKERRDREVARAVAVSEAESRARLIALQQAAVDQSVLLRVVSPLIQTTLLGLRERARTMITITATTTTANDNNNNHNDTIGSVDLVEQPISIDADRVSRVVDTKRSALEIDAGEKSGGSGHDNDVANLPQLSRANRDNDRHLIGDDKFAASHHQINPSLVLGGRTSFGSGGSWGGRGEVPPPRLSEANAEQMAMVALSQESPAEQDTRDNNDLGRRGQERGSMRHRNNSVRFAQEAEVLVEYVGLTKGNKARHEDDERVKLARESRAHERETQREERANHERREEAHSLMNKTVDSSETPMGSSTSVDIEKRLQKLRRSQQQQQKQRLERDPTQDQSKSATDSREKRFSQRSAVDSAQSPAEKLKVPAHDSTIETLPEGATQSRASKEEKTDTPSSVKPSTSPSIADLQGRSLGKTSSDNIEPTMPQVGASGTSTARRKPSEERVQEPRAVFVHRASLIEAAAAGVVMETGSGGTLDGCAEVGGGDGPPSVKRRPSKPGVGSLPMSP